MPVEFGIVCGRCGKFHFVCADARTSRIRYDREREEFKVACMCSYSTYFRSDRLVPFIVAEEDLQRGYSEIEDCRPIAVKSGDKGQ